MSERKGPKALELWCRRITEGYNGVNVINMTTSWRDGLAFCAIIHHFRPDLIDFAKLNKDDVYHNNELAFRVAEQYLGIPALLEPEDMVEYAVPDRLSILTYLSQFFQVFGMRQATLPSLMSAKRQTSPDHDILSTPGPSKAPTKVSTEANNVTSSSSTHHYQPIRRKLCAKCSLPFSIGEALKVGTFSYHRTCFRCARCNVQLTLYNYYEIEESNEYCCERCSYNDVEEHDSEMRGDEEEEQQQVDDDDDDEFTRVATILTRSLCDEEKSAGLIQQQQQEDKARLTFLHTQIADEETTSDCDSNTATSNIKQTVNNVNLEVSDDRIKNLNNNVSRNENGSNKNLVASDCSGDVKLEDSHVVTKEAINAIAAKGSLVKAHVQLIESKKSDNNSSSDQVPLIMQTNYNLSTNSNLDNGKQSQQQQVEEKQNDSVIDLTTTQDEIDLTTSVDYSNDLNETNEQKSEISDNQLASNEEVNEDFAPIPAVRKKIVVSTNEGRVTGVYTPRESVNPFEDDSDEVEEQTTPIPAVRKTLLSAANERKTQYINPFEDDYESDENNEEMVPAPRPSVRKKISVSSEAAGNPFEDDDDDDDDGGQFCKIPRIKTNEFDGENEEEGKPQTMSKNHAGGCSTEFKISPNVTLRKKKPAPKPPISSSTTSLVSSNNGDESNSGQSSLTSSPCHYGFSQSVQSTPKVRKTKKAPPPPQLRNYESDKIAKDERNRTRQQNKRQKGQAPSRPIPPQRRPVTYAIPLAEIRREFDTIEIQLQGLDKQASVLEDIIRKKSEDDDDDPNKSFSPEVDDMVLQLFEVVNEKNQLLRRQTELMYLRKQQRLEMEYADVEYQIRCLMLIPESQQTDSTKGKEEELTKRLIDIVEQRSEIIDCLEMDRLRESAEDSSINSHLNMYNEKKKENAMSIESSGSKKEKKSKGKIDGDKDIDESCVIVKGKKKKRNIFNIVRDKK